MFWVKPHSPIRKMKDVHTHIYKHKKCVYVGDEKIARCFPDTQLPCHLPDIPDQIYKNKYVTKVENGKETSKIPFACVIRQN